VLAAGEGTTNGAFTLAEFTGGPGSWTVPHVHRELEESFYVLDGEFTFAVGEQEIAAGPGVYVLVPRGTRHGITAGAEGGRSAN
jgi:quercetin dioxygenase-like cupin family protein